MTVLKDAKLCLTAKDMALALTYGLDTIIAGDFEVQAVFYDNSMRPFSIVFTKPVNTKDGKK